MFGQAEEYPGSTVTQTPSPTGILLQLTIHNVGLPFFIYDTQFHYISLIIENQTCSVILISYYILFSKIKFLTGH